MFAKIIRALNAFFTEASKAARLHWEFRIRFENNLNGWVIETNEGGEKWIAMCKRVPEQHNQQVVVVYEDYNAANEAATNLGLHGAYEQAFFIPPRAAQRQPTPNEQALTQAALERATMGSTMGNGRHLSPVGARH